MGSLYWFDISCEKNKVFMTDARKRLSECYNMGLSAEPLAKRWGDRMRRRVLLC